MFHSDFSDLDAPFEIKADGLRGKGLVTECERKLDNDALWIRLPMATRENECLDSNSPAELTR